MIRTALEKRAETKKGSINHPPTDIWGCDNLRFLRPLDTINNRSVRYDYNATGYLSGPVYIKSEVSNTAKVLKINVSLLLI